ncbi:hypothetical protein PaG_00533 [Moesziomyces aphidis]|uniref:Uncharacterized protein n=1 Tax=Moesziomyces aphidis TaxID=84754 RepID=W3VU49_MOEAP|nr:hypothetical protein PaG_00533 [Moesziomyces aphidis]
MQLQEPSRLLGLIFCWLYLLTGAIGTSEESDGVDLSLRLGPRPAAIRFPHGNVVSGPSGSSGQLTEASSSGQAQRERDQPGPSTSSRPLMQGSGEASAMRGVGTHMDRWPVESSRQLIQRLDAHENWEAYTRKYLGRPLEPFVHDGSFIPQKAMEFQTRIDLLVRAKREKAVLRQPFRNWRTMSRSIAVDDSTSVRVAPKIVYRAHEDLALLRSKEDILRRLALMAS